MGLCAHTHSCTCEIAVNYRSWCQQGSNCVNSHKQVRNEHCVYPPITCEIAHSAWNYRVWCKQKATLFLFQQYLNNMSLNKHRLHLSPDENFHLKPLKNKSNSSHIGKKPKGLWYACGTEWMKSIRTSGMIADLTDESIDWIRMGSTWNDCYLYHFEIDMSGILQIETPSQFENFQEKYGVFLPYPGDPNFSYCIAIRWNEVAANYAGIQICPFMLQPLINLDKIGPFTRRLTRDELYAWRLWQDFYQKCYWYHGWDIASGCVWDTSAIQKVILVATKKQKDSKFNLLWPAMKKAENLQRNRIISPIHDIPDSYLK